jgi:hypothetical protein
MSKPPKRSWLWLQGLCCGAVVCLATPTALLLGVLLLPGLVAFKLDREIVNPVSRAVLFGGGALSVATVQELWLRGHTMAISLELLEAPGVIAWAWAGACAGWLLREGTWLALGLTAEITASRQTGKLTAERVSLQSEWNAEVPGLLNASRAMSK